MQTTRPHSRRRQGHVDPFAGETLGQFCLLEALFLAFVIAFEILFYGIQQLAKLRALFRRDLAEFFADLRERSFAPERLYTGLLQLFERDRGGECRERGAPQFFEPRIGHYRPPSVNASSMEAMS